MSGEQNLRRKKFEELADSFVARVKAEKITASTKVTLVYQCVDRNGKQVSVPTSLVPNIDIDMPGNRQLEEELTAGIRTDTIIGNINSLVRPAPLEFVMLRDAPQIPL